MLRSARIPVQDTLVETQHYPKSTDRKMVVWFKSEFVIKLYYDMYDSTTYDLWREIALRWTTGQAEKAFMQSEVHAYHHTMEITSGIVVVVPPANAYKLILDVYKHLYGIKPSENLHAIFQLIRKDDSANWIIVFPNGIRWQFYNSIVFWRDLFTAMRDGHEGCIGTFYITVYDNTVFVFGEEGFWLCMKRSAIYGMLFPHTVSL